MNLKLRSHHRATKMASFRLSLLSLCLSVIWILNTDIPISAQTGPPRFESSGCPFEDYEIPPDERIECGYLIVPEDRRQLNSRTIRLAAALIRTPNTTPAPDPIIFLHGGPGLGALDLVDLFVGDVPQIRANRNIILLDQRGTGYSQPNLQCHEFINLSRETQEKNLSLEESVALEVEAATQCHDRLVSEGVNLAAYTTTDIAADVNDLRLALGYEEWNLWGLSYGTQLALTVMRDYPEGIRSAILDSALPLEANWFDGRAAITASAFEIFFTGCASDPACQATYPRLDQQFYNLVDRFNAKPIPIMVPDSETGAPTPALFTGEDAINGLFSALYDTDLIPYLPLAIEQIHAGNYQVITGLAGALSSDPSIDHSGLWYSVKCHDEAPFNEPAEMQADLETHPRLRHFVLSDSTLAVCPIWAAGQASPIEDQPVQSNIPALILAGQYDPIHPVAWSMDTAKALSRDFFYELPGSGHGVSFDGCGLELVTQFVNNPAASPTTDCLTKMTGPAFVTNVYLNQGVFKLATGLLEQPELLPVSLLLLCLIIFLAAVIGWPVALWLARWHSPPGQISRSERSAWWLAWLVAVLNLVFGAGLAWFIVNTAQATPYLLLFGLPGQAAPLFSLPWLAAVLSLGLLVFAGLVWKNRLGPVAGRVGYSLVTGAALAFLGWLNYWGLMIG